MGKPQYLHHQYQHNHNTNHHPLLEHISNRGTGQRTVNHHYNRWRDDGPKPTGHYQKSCGPRPWITLFDHIPVEHGSDGNDCCRGRSRQGSKECTGQYQRQAHTASHVAHQAVRKIYNPPGNPPLRHKIASQYKKCNGHDRAGLQPAKDPLGDSRGGGRKAPEHHGRQ